MDNEDIEYEDDIDDSTSDFSYEDDSIADDDVEDDLGDYNSSSFVGMNNNYRRSPVYGRSLDRNNYRNKGPIKSRKNGSNRNPSNNNDKHFGSGAGLVPGGASSLDKSGSGVSDKLSNATEGAEKVSDGIDKAKNTASTIKNPLNNKKKNEVSGNVKDTAEKVRKDVEETAKKLAKKINRRILLVVLITVGLVLMNIILISAFFYIIAGASSINSNDDDGAIAFSAGGYCAYTNGKSTMVDIKVKLLSCEGNSYVPGEDLIDFEDYITGVVYQEVGDAPYEALKAQAIVARSFSLTRPSIMGNAFGIGLKEENGHWILSLRSCTNDQVFCNPNKGCWSLRTGGQTSNSNSGDWPNCTVYSGYDKSKPWSRPPLPENSQIRKAVQETKGQVLLDSNGKVVYTDFNNSNQTRWSDMAKSGKDVFEILTKDYGSGKKISTPNCSSDDSEVSLNGKDYVQWMVNLAADNSRGYSQTTRSMNPNVDCSSFVYYGLLKGGGYSISQLGSYPFTTSTMRPILEKIGFKGYRFTGVSALKRGDILWRSGHTEVYVGNGKNVGAHSNYDGKNGDSSGKEVNVEDTGSNWRYYFRKSTN